jgi:osmotically inducible lipoprotein OsmB
LPSRKQAFLREIIMTKYVVAVAFALTTLAGCGSTNETVGTVGGAALGGVAGSAISGGSTLGTVGGAAVGGTKSANARTAARSRGIRGTPYNRALDPRGPKTAGASRIALVAAAACGRYPASTRRLLDRYSTNRFRGGSGTDQAAL